MATDNQAWKELCSWVETEIFGYDGNQKLQKNAILRLKGLSTGQVFANNKCEKHGNYSYDVVLVAFKVNKDKILQSIAIKEFTSEENKMAYVCAIVRNNLNDVYTRMNNAKKSSDKTEAVNTDTITHTSAEYTPQRTEKINEKFKDLW